MVGGKHLLLSEGWNFGRNWPTPVKNADFQSILVRSAWAVLPSEKS